MGIVTDIQRFTLNDGPGIRTTVFLKGCNMACGWCHNPETLSMEPQLMIYPQKCTGCAACVDFDPEKAARGLPPAREALSPADAGKCFAGALAAAGREMTAAEVLAEAAQDADYYRESGGGVTLSGGEVMAQAAFAKEILALCREKGISTAIETNLAYDFSALEELLPLLDLVMADVKLMDGPRHAEATGVGNERVLENVKRLAASGVPYILRTPLVPGVNATQAEIGAIAAFAAGNGGKLLYYELLNFNPLGASKYEALGAENRYGEARPSDAAALAALVAAAEAAGIEVRVG